MSEGEGFARRVTLANLQSFSPLLETRRAAEQGGGADADAANEQSTDSANEGFEEDPELVEAEKRFNGESIKTGITYSRPTLGHPGSTGGTGGRGFGGGHTASAGSEEVLLMRVRPRRNGTQLQISMIVHKAPFMNSTPEVVSAADNSRRTIGYDYVKRGDERVPNLARFEAPEMGGMANPVARFRWVDAGESGRAADRILQYEIFDADNSSRGYRIFEKLKQGISTPPERDLNQMSREETVLSKSDPDSAQWYRLDTV